jgi:hypothetical protein
MTQRGTDRGSWPDLPYPAWRETCTTLHLWTQIVGKIRLSQTPWLNHSWQVPLYVTVRGLTTSSIPYGDQERRPKIRVVVTVSLNSFLGWWPQATSSESKRASKRGRFPSVSAFSAF